MQNVGYVTFLLPRSSRAATMSRPGREIGCPIIVNWGAGWDGHFNSLGGDRCSPIEIAHLYSLHNPIDTEAHIPALMIHASPQ